MIRLETHYQCVTAMGTTLKQNAKRAYIRGKMYISHGLFFKTKSASKSTMFQWWYGTHQNGKRHPEVDRQTKFH